jgi:hypothetical protein
MKKIARLTRTAVVGWLAGAMVFQSGGCTTQAVKTQLSKGLSTSLNGLFNIVASNLANEIFDVDD